ncbi:MAG: alanine racemase [Phycisphaeraceae bacterium]|nr:alanine racemase [Phycisphaeraceae bacterium]
MANRIAEYESLRDAYRSVRDRVRDALIQNDRHPDDAVLIAVSSHAPPDSIRQLVELGHADFGETQPQQLAQRIVSMEEHLGRKRFLSRPRSAQPADNNGNQPATEVRWHMIGALPRNKAKLFARWTRLIHQVDTLRLAEELHALGSKLDRREEIRPIEVLLRINVLSDPAEPGLVPPAAMHVAAQIDTMVHLQLRGIMVEAPKDMTDHQSEHFYDRTRDVFEELKSAKVGGGRFNLLSMGRSEDFQTAIRFGANLLRVGRAIFGSEDSPTR